MNKPKSLFSWRPDSSGRRQITKQSKADGKKAPDWGKCPTDKENCWMKEVVAAGLPRRVRLWATPWAGPHQTPLSMGFSRQGH